MSYILGNSCCCGCDGSDNHLQFNCNEISDSKGDFSLDVSDVKIEYLDIERKNTTLNAIHDKGDFYLCDSDFLIYKSKNPISMYNNDNIVTNLNLKFEARLEENDYQSKITYNIVKKLSDNYSTQKNGGLKVMIDGLDFKKRFYYPEYDKENSNLSLSQVAFGSEISGTYYLAHEAEKIINRCPDEIFDVQEHKWHHDLKYNGIDLRLWLKISKSNSEDIINVTSINQDGSVDDEITTTINYNRPHIVIDSVELFMSDNMYDKVSVKNTPYDMLNVKLADNNSSYYAIGVFNHKKKIGISSFAMLPLLDNIFLVNENKDSSKISIINLVL